MEIVWSFAAVLVAPSARRHEKWTSVVLLLNKEWLKFFFWDAIATWDGSESKQLNARNEVYF